MADTRMILDGEHEELLEMLEEVSSNKAGTGDIFSGVLRIFRNHLKKESETVIPLLGYLKDRLDGVDRGKKIDLSRAGSRFKESYPVMMQEHAEMSNLIRMAQDSVKTKPDKLASKLASDLLHHVTLEEEFLYPAAFASADLVGSENRDSGHEIKR